VNSPAELRKVIWGVILTILWVCCFLFIKPTLVIDWAGDGSVQTSLLMVVSLIGLLVIVLFHIFYPSRGETTKLSLTACLTVVWFALIFFYPFKTTTAGGAMGFFALIGGLAVCVLWVRFFSDEVLA